MTETVVEILYIVSIEHRCDWGGDVCYEAVEAHLMTRLWK